METHIIKVDNIPDAWFQCIYDIHNDEEALADIWRVDKGSFEGTLRREFKSILIEIENPCDPDLSKRIPRIPEGKCIPNPIDATMPYTVMCPVCGEYITSFKNTVDKPQANPCGHEVEIPFYDCYKPTIETTVFKYYERYLFGNELSPNEQYTYGSRIMEPVEVPYDLKNSIVRKVLNIFGNNILVSKDKTRIEVPQYYYLCSYLKTNPQSNQIIMQIGKPSDVTLPDPPCLRQIDMRVIDGKLHWFIYFRSWDLWGGLPLNLVGLSLLMDQMCVDTDLEPGGFTCHSKGLHLYEHSWSSALARLGRSNK